MNSLNDTAAAHLYVAAILDLYSRFVVSWAVNAVNDRHLTSARSTSFQSIRPLRS